MSILKNYKLEPWIIRTLKAIQSANKDPSEKQTIVVLINTSAGQKDLVFGPCPNVKDTRKDKKGSLEVHCGRVHSWILFDPNCLNCAHWKPTPQPAEPTPTPEASASEGGS